ncbi:nucleotidyltransferase domain-containing protein [Candidatus Peregrinibacteria bacterium]|nr:nucleotidyltransferase domain-containing protein [Candidatus Peregrinibacteria bacterium]
MILPKSKLVQKLLLYFFLNPHKQLYLRELARTLDCDAANLDKVLKKFEREGLFASEFRGKQKYYFLNQKFPFYKEYKNIVEKSFGIQKFLIFCLEKFNGVKLAYLCGSYAKNAMEPHSDIDLLVIGEVDVLKFSREIAKFEKEYGREINYTVMSEKEFEKKKRDDPLLKNIFRGKTIKFYEKV